jgi:hypothetical protein
MKHEFSWQVFGKSLKYQISSKSVQWEPRCSLRTDRWTGRRTWKKLIIAFRKVAKSAKNDAEIKATIGSINSMYEISLPGIGNHIKYMCLEGLKVIAFDGKVSWLTVGFLNIELVTALLIMNSQLALQPRGGGTTTVNHPRASAWNWSHYRAACNHVTLHTGVINTHHTCCTLCHVYKWHMSTALLQWSNQRHVFPHELLTDILCLFLVSSFLASVQSRVISSSSSFLISFTAQGVF